MITPADSEYYQYEYVLTGWSGQPLWVAVTSFDYGYAQTQIAPQESELSANAQPVCLALKGDLDHSGRINLGDIVNLVNYLFDKDKPPCLGIYPGNCWAPDFICRADVDNSGEISISDIIYLVSYMFDKDRLPCKGSDPGNCWTPLSEGVCCLPVP